MHSIMFHIRAVSLLQLCNRSFSGTCVHLCVCAFSSLFRIRKGVDEALSINCSLFNTVQLSRRMFQGADEHREGSFDE